MPVEEEYDDSRDLELMFSRTMPLVEGSALISDMIGNSISDEIELVLPAPEEEDIAPYDDSRDLEIMFSRTTTLVPVGSTLLSDRIRNTFSKEEEEVLPTIDDLEKRIEDVRRECDEFETKLKSIESDLNKIRLLKKAL